MSKHYNQFLWACMIIWIISNFNQSSSHFILPKVFSTPELVPRIRIHLC